MPIVGPIAVPLPWPLSLDHSVLWAQRRAQQGGSDGCGACAEKERRWEGEQSSRRRADSPGNYGERVHPMQTISFRQRVLWLTVVGGVGLLVILMQMGLGSQRVHAASGGPSFSLRPLVSDPANPATRSYVVLNATPGHVLQSNVRVVNSGSAAGSVDLYGVDATTGQTGGIVYVSPEQAQSQVGSWIKLGATHLTLAPGQSQDVSFQVVVPVGALPGQHMGGITAKSIASQSVQQQGPIRVVVQNLSILAVQVNVPGTPVEQLRATTIQIGEQSGYQTVMVGLRNTGSVILQPSGSLEVVDAGGHVVQDFPLKLGSFLPQTSITYPFYVKQSLSAGVYQAVLTLTYGHGHTLNSTQAFTVSQAQVKPPFNPSALAQPTASSNIFSSMPLWQLLLVVCAAGVLLFTGGRKIARLVTTSRHNHAHAAKKGASSAKRRTNKVA